MSKDDKDTKDVRKAYGAWKNFNLAFNAMPIHLRKEVGALMEARIGDENLASVSIENAFLEWFAGGRA